MKVQQPTLIELSNLALRSIIIAQTRTNIQSIHTTYKQRLLYAQVT